MEAGSQNLKEYVLLSYQPFSIEGNGGGARIIRRLIDGRENMVIFISLVDSKSSALSSKYNQLEFVLYPSSKKWVRSFIRTVYNTFRNKFLFPLNAYFIQKKILGLKFKILHVVDHGKYSDVLSKICLRNEIPIWVSFHDHFNTSGASFNKTQNLWRISTKRMVISEEMGNLYCHLFGMKDYLIITDGLKELEISSVHISKIDKTLAIYFGGLLHIDYYPLFKAFCEALNLLNQEKQLEITLILRGTQKLLFLGKLNFKIEYRDFCLDTNILKNEMEECDIFYLPIKYTSPDFYKYSLSTKMIGYLGSSGNIFYHGPSDSAAAKLLAIYNAGQICDSLNPDFILESLKKVIRSHFEYSSNAKNLARNKFLLKDKQQLFWS